MPAGQYDVDRHQGNDSVLSLSCYDCQARIMALTNSISGDINLHTKDRLVFHKYGDTYFLSEVWSSARSTGNCLPKSKTEGELSRRVSRAQISQVVLAARR